MSGFNGRRGNPLNVSQLLQDLNRVPEPAAQPEETLPNLDEELAMFTNTNFIDWDSGTPRSSAHESSTTTSPTTDRVPPEAVGSDLSSFDFTLSDRPSGSTVPSRGDPDSWLVTAIAYGPSGSLVHHAPTAALWQAAETLSNQGQLQCGFLANSFARLAPHDRGSAYPTRFFYHPHADWPWAKKMGSGSGDFNGFDFHNYPTSNVNGFSDSLGSLAPIQPSPTYSSNGAQGSYGTSMHSGDKISADAPPRRRQLSFEEQSRLAAEEDKRRRNTAASARFRVKKKAREQALEKREKELSDKVGSLESRISSLETENKWLRELVMEKNGGSDSSVSTLLERQKPESTRKAAAQTKPE